MGDLVNARPPRPFRMTFAHGEQNQYRPPRPDLGGKNGAPPPSRLGDVELHTATEASPIATVVFAAPQPLPRYPLGTKAGDHSFDRRPARRCAVCKILGEDLVDDPDLEARTRARAHRDLSLAVGRQ